MLEKFDYTSVPRRFAHCFKADCPKAGECLRYQVTTVMPDNLSCIWTVNPRYTPAEEGCDYFKSCQPLVYAEGMDRLLVDLPYQKACEIKQKMIAHFGKTHFYRLKRKERRFGPKDLQYVGRLFKREGIMEKPVFDVYKEEFDW